MLNTDLPLINNDNNHDNTLNVSVTHKSCKNFLKLKFESHLVFVNFTSVNLYWAQCSCYRSNLI